jgi:hypothetical protein
VLAAGVSILREAPWAESQLQRSEARSSRDELTAAFALGNFDGSAAACNLSMAACELAELTHNRDDGYPHPESVAERLDQMHGPLPGGRSVDFWSAAAGEESRGAEEHFLTLSVSQEWAAQAVFDQGQSGLACRVLDGLPWCLARAVGLLHSGEDRKRPIAAIDWGYGETTFCLIWRGAPQFVRRLRHCELEPLLRLIQERSGSSLDEAGCLLTRRGSSSPSPPDDGVLQEAQQAVEAALDQLAQEVERTVAYLRSYRRGLAPEEFVVFGGGATIPDVETALSRRLLDARVRVWTLDAHDSTQDSPNAPLALFGPAAALSLLGAQRR